MFDELDLYLDYEREPTPPPPIVHPIDYTVDEAQDGSALREVEAIAALRDWLAQLKPEDYSTEDVTVFENVSGTVEDDGEGPVEWETIHAWNWNNVFTDATLVRWFDSRGGDLDKCKNALLRHVKWRIENRVWEITAETVSKELSSDFIVFGGPDTSSYPCVFVFARNHDKNSVTHEETQRFVSYMLEEALAKCKVSRSELGEDRKYADQFTLVFDLWGFGLINMNYDAIATLIEVAKYHYPYILKRILIVNTPWIFKACFTIIQGFLPAGARDLIGFANNYDEMSEFIGLSNLPELTIFAREGEEEENGDIAAEFNNDR